MEFATVPVPFPPVLAQLTPVPMALMRVLPQFPPLPPYACPVPFAAFAVQLTAVRPALGTIAAQFALVAPGLAPIVAQLPSVPTDLGVPLVTLLCIRGSRDERRAAAPRPSVGANASKHPRLWLPRWTRDSPGR